MKPLVEYKTLVFDCDGVVLNSNQLKIQAYYDVAIQFGANEEQAQALVAHHVKLGGISRYPKFHYFLCEIMQQEVTEESMHQLLSTFTNEVKRLLTNCEVAPNLAKLRQAHPDAKWMIISGGDQNELREIFECRNLSNLFNAGIFGSPDNKEQILARELANGNISTPALFIGDSRYDYQASTNAGLDFVFLTEWTDVPDWQAFCSENKIQTAPNLASLMS